MTIDIGRWTFASRGEFDAHIVSIMERPTLRLDQVWTEKLKARTSKPVEGEDDEFLRALIAQYPARRKFAADIESIRVQQIEEPTGLRRRFVVVRTDGTSQGFGWEWVQ